STPFMVEFGRCIFERFRRCFVLCGAAFVFAFRSVVCRTEPIGGIGLAAMAFGSSCFSYSGWLVYPLVFICSAVMHGLGEQKYSSVFLAYCIYCLDVANVS